ncbi:hypothetical protein [Methyloprofundus sedimenti]|uniref:hypothetical protein n=1 Tax=Methyloprofundus sedimenti TaxID=1420851 RepID=UPI001301CBC9|nr:hypothetical protein [Methyloprofundus sedimenti]
MSLTHRQVNQIAIFGRIISGFYDNSDHLYLQQTQLLDYCRAESDAETDRVLQSEEDEP